MRHPGYRTACRESSNGNHAPRSRYQPRDQACRNLDRSRSTSSSKSLRGSYSARVLATMRTSANPGFPIMSIPLSRARAHPTASVLSMIPIPPPPTAFPVGCPRTLGANPLGGSKPSRSQIGAKSSVSTRTRRGRSPRHWPVLGDRSGGGVCGRHARRSRPLRRSRRRDPPSPHSLALWISDADAPPRSGDWH